MERVPLRLPPHLDRGEDGTCLRGRLRGDRSDRLASHDSHLDALHAARPHPADICSKVHSQGPDDGRSEVTSSLEAYQSSLTGLLLLADSSRASATFKASRPPSAALAISACDSSGVVRRLCLCCSSPP